MRFKGYTLNEFQVRAVRAIEDGRDVLVSAPTGAGKTLVAEFAIDRAVKLGRRVIYTAPIKALSNQKYRDFQSEGLDVGLSTGDLTLEPGAAIVIMTTEIFRNAIFEDPRRFDDVEHVIFDEIHFLDDPERGTVWEESLIFAPRHLKIVGLSATISNLAQFGKWLGEARGHDLEIVRHDKRPVPLDHQLFHRDVGLFKIAQRQRALQTVKRLRAQESPRDRGRSRGRGSSRDRRGGHDRGPHPSQLVLDRLEDDRLLPVLFFCFSRKECEIKAERNLHRRVLTRPEQERMQQLFDEVCTRFELDPDRDQALHHILERALQGVGFHHAGMLPIHKEVVERLFTSGLLKLLFTTETFALGINMPARTVVFDSLRKFDGVTFDYMPARDYLQMAGRAGRQGIDKEGLVISILDDEALADAPLADLFGGKVEPIQSRFNLSYSTIVNLWERMGEGLLDAYDKSFAAFQATGGSQKKQERARSHARAALRARIAVLEQAGYVDANGKLLDRGRIAQRINGYEIQTTELLFDGVLDELDKAQLAVLFCAVVHESRRGQDSAEGRRVVAAAVARRAENAVRRFQAIEALHGFRSSIKALDFGLSVGVLAWAQGASMRKVEHVAAADGGDFVRTLRMAIQMMRQLRSALGKGYPLADRLEEAIVTVNRDEVDAKRQFELG
ncbi:MAG: DEAD/DEAH box helicase [Planctomycetes bacterium]|nr:DEAD/DEAH box helicase [Planctomycetota bacterium]